MSLYLVVKVAWIVAAAFGRASDGYGTADWTLLNAVTVVMAATGVALGLAQRWGRRLHAMPRVLLRSGGFTTAEYVLVAVAEHVLGIGVGLVFLVVLLRIVATPGE
ncbi:hypothetical protein ACQEU3_07330 [Spirillospora sp. CA-253888]